MFSSMNKVGASRRGSYARNLWLLKLIRVSMTSGAVMISSIVLYFQACGLSLFEIFVLQSLFAVMLAALEVPTGTIADYYGRKHSILMGVTLDVAGSVLYALTTSFWGFLIAEALFAAAFACLSGADESLFKESLLKLNRGGEFQQRWGSLDGLSKMLAAVFCILGSTLAAKDLWLPLVVTAILSSLGPVSALLLIDTKDCNSENQAVTFRGLAKSTFQLMSSNRSLTWLLAFAGLIGSTLTAALWLYQPYFQLLKLPVAHFGWYFAAMNLVAALGAWKADWLERVVGRQRLHWVMVLLLCGSFLLMSTRIGVWWLLAVLPHQFVRGLSETALTNQLHEQVPSEIRATVGSLKSLCSRLTGAVLLPPIGWIADLVGVLITLRILGLLVAVTAFILFWQRRMPIRIEPTTVTP